MNIVAADSMTALLTEEQVLEILAGPWLMRLAFLGKDGSPIVSPVWFVFEKNRLWTTISKTGLKARSLAADNRVYFTIDTSREKEGTFGVRGPAQARLIDDNELTETVVRAHLRKYLGSEEGPMAEAFIQESRAGKNVVAELEVGKYVAWRYAMD